MTNDQMRRVHAAMCAAYPQRSSVQMLIGLQIGRNYDDLTPPGVVPVEYFNILTQAKAQGWAIDLVQAMLDDPAQANNAPFRQELTEVLQDLNAEVAAPRVARPPNPDPARSDEADVLDERREDALQRLVNANDPSVDARALLARLDQISTQVGAIEAGGSHQGTCLLVGPDLVLTNFHVIEPLKALRGVMTLEVRFDHEKDANGIIHEGWTVPFAPRDWCIAEARYSHADTTNDPDDVAESGELDFAVLRLAEAVDTRPYALKPEMVRGYCALGTPETDLAPLDNIIVVQHPMGAPLQMAFGHVLSFGGAGRRVRYSANTKKGASGSPVLNQRGELVALHHAGDPNFDRMAQYNQGVPIGLIYAAILAAVGGAAHWPLGGTP